MTKLQKKLRDVSLILQIQREDLGRLMTERAGDYPAEAWMALEQLAHVAQTLRSLSEDESTTGPADTKARAAVPPPIRNLFNLKDRGQVGHIPKESYVP